MARRISNRRRRGRGERRGLRRALILSAIIGHRHWRWNVSVRCLYACARRLAMCLGRRLFADAMWRRRGLLHWQTSRGVNITASTAIVGFIQFAVRTRDVRVFWWACCALVLCWRDDIIGRRHSPVEREPGSQAAGYRVNISSRSGSMEVGQSGPR